MTNQDASKATRRRVAGNSSVGEQGSNVMARRASAYIRRSSGSQHRSKKEHSKKLASIGLVVMIIILMGITLMLVQMFGGKPKESVMIEQSSHDFNGRAQVEVGNKEFPPDHFYSQYDFDMDGNQVFMSSFEGNVLLLVNVASL